MYSKLTVILFTVLTLLLTACQNSATVKPTASNTALPAQTLYTQFSLFEEKNNFRTTNYRKGTLIPINTAATLVSMEGKEAEVRLSNGGTLTIENVPKYTKDNMQAAFNKIFATTKVNLNQFSPAEREAIMTGQVIRGMSKKAVIAAIGYPPQHETPSLSGNAWKYWGNRFDTFIVHFKQDKVDSIQQ